MSGLAGYPFTRGDRSNIVTEDLVFMLDQMVLSTGIELDRLMATRAILNAHLPPKHLTLRRVA